MNEKLREKGISGMNDGSLVTDGIGGKLVNLRSSIKCAARLEQRGSLNFPRGSDDKLAAALGFKRKYKMGKEYPYG